MRHSTPAFYTSTLYHHQVCMCDVGGTGHGDTPQHVGPMSNLTARCVFAPHQQTQVMLLQHETPLASGLTASFVSC